MKVLFLTQFDERGASSRCRVHQYLPGLRARGIEATVLEALPPAREFARAAREADIVCIQKRRLPLSLLLRLRRASGALLFDFDDAIWLRYSSGPGVRPAPLVKRLRLAAVLRLADRVIAGNDTLAAYARRFNRSVTVLPTPVDTDRLRPSGAVLGAPSTASGASLRLGWVGHPDNLRYVRDLEPAFERLALEFPDLTLRVFSSAPYEGSALRVENLPWSLAGEVESFQSFDIGLMPLRDDPWTRGKCAYKALQYMAAGLPSVCSPVGMNWEVIRDGETGLLAGDQQAWIDALRRLLQDAALRFHLGTTARKFVTERYSLSVMTDRLAGELASLSARGKGAVG